MKTERWQFLISNSILGPVLSGVRRNGRGPWLGGIETDKQIPSYVLDYMLFVEHNGRRVLHPDNMMTLAEYRAEISGGEGVQLNVRTAPGVLKGYVAIPQAARPPKVKTRKIPARTPAIRCLQDLVDHFGADEPRGLNRRLYKDTECGASISVETPDGKWHHNGEDWSGITEITAFTIQTIVEGSDAEVNGPDFVLPVTVAEVDEWIEDMEAQASELWDEANAEDEELVDA